MLTTVLLINALGVLPINYLKKIYITFERKPQKIRKIYEIGAQLVGGEYDISICCASAQIAFIRTGIFQSDNQGSRHTGL